MKCRVQIKLVAKGYESVYRGSWIETLVSVKFIKIELNVQSRHIYIKQADLWITLQHPHIERIFGACHVGNPYFVCESTSHGNLLECANHDRRRIWKWLHEAALGLLYLHAKARIVHQDIKGSNIIIGDSRVAKLTGFERSRREDDLSSFGDATTENLRWMAPECITDDSRGSFAADVYSFGMTIIKVVTQRAPYEMIDDATLMFSIRKKLHKLPEKPEEISDAQWNLINCMCATNPGDRIDLGVAV